jgi:hypothetical protein
MVIDKFVSILFPVHIIRAQPPPHLSIPEVSIISLLSLSKSSHKCLLGARGGRDRLLELVRSLQQVQIKLEVARCGEVQATTAAQARTCTRLQTGPTVGRGSLLS